MIYRTCKDITDAVTAVICDYNSAPTKAKIEKLYYCRAWIIMTDNSDFLILQSYTNF